ncbi:MAG: F0F1 ATP synthase subunit epsilon [Chloroflexota bacterium]|nr:F0F1 ATP synthase subunit epsilon [Chloroflexota bacterium]
MPAMRLEIVTAERVVYSEDVNSVLAPGTEGELGILPNHSPLLTTLKPGELRVEKDGNQFYMAVSGGFMEVLGNKVTVIADTAERLEEIDSERAEQALNRAEDFLNNTSSSSDIDLQRALLSMRRSQARLKVAQRKRRSNSR